MTVQHMQTIWVQCNKAAPMPRLFEADSYTSANRCDCIPTFVPPQQQQRSLGGSAKEQLSVAQAGQGWQLQPSKSVSCQINSLPSLAATAQGVQSAVQETTGMAAAT